VAKQRFPMKRRPICAPMQADDPTAANYLEPTRLEEVAGDGRLLGVLGSDRPRVAVFVNEHGFVAIAQIEGKDDVYASVVLDPRDAVKLGQALLRCRPEKATKISASGRRRRGSSKRA
jgi:hypothetical protein